MHRTDHIDNEAERHECLDVLGHHEHDGNAVEYNIEIDMLLHVDKTVILTFNIYTYINVSAYT